MDILRNVFKLTEQNSPKNDEQYGEGHDGWGAIHRSHERVFHNFGPPPPHE